MCGEVQEGVYCPLVPLPEPDYSRGYKVTSTVLIPEHCAQRMRWIPQPVGVDTFTPFTIQETIRGRVESITVDSLSKLRQVERESAQRYKNGEGRQLNWRDYSQDASNRDRGSLGEKEKVTLSAADKRKWGLRGAAKALKDEPAGELGLGVSESTASALVESE